MMVLAPGAAAFSCILPLAASNGGRHCRSCMGFVRNNRRILIAAPLLQVGVQQALMRLHPDYIAPWYQEVIYFIPAGVEYPWIKLANMMFAAGRNYYLCHLTLFVFGSATLVVVMLCCRRLIRAANRVISSL
jgi:hypothetical protein